MVAELKEVLQKVEQLDNNEQQSIAKLINEELEWENTLSKTQDKLATLAKEAVENIKLVKPNSKTGKVKSETTARFRKALSNLPADVQQRARKFYKLWKENNNHPALHFKQVHKTEPITLLELVYLIERLALNKMICFGFGLAHMKSTTI